MTEIVEDIPPIENEVENAVEGNFAPLATSTESLGGDSKCSCVTWLRTAKGIPIRGDAINIQPNVDRPYVGGVVLMKFGTTGHAALITHILPSGALWVIQANRIKCKVTEGVVFPNDPRVRGYWFKNINFNLQ